MSNQFIDAALEEIENTEKRQFTVTVDFTIDLDEILAEVLEDVEDVNEQIEAEARSNVDEFWRMTDMELTNVVMDDLDSALEDVGMKMVPVRFRRGNLSE